MLGTEEDFCRLCQEANKRGMRVILDGVFNHTGSDSVYFNAAGSFPSLGAAQSQDSPYYTWYHFHPLAGPVRRLVGHHHPAGRQRVGPRAMGTSSSTVPDSVIRRWLRLRRLRLAAGRGRRAAGLSSSPRIRTACEETKAGQHPHRRGVGGRLQQDRLLPAPAVPPGPRDPRAHELPLPQRRCWPILRGGDAADFRETMETIRENYPPAAFYSADELPGHPRHRPHSHGAGGGARCRRTRRPGPPTA